jgi:hypothetical protein
MMALDAVALVAHDFVRSGAYDAQRRIEWPAKRVCCNPEDSAEAVGIEGMHRLNLEAAPRTDVSGAVPCPLERSAERKICWITSRRTW